MAKFLPTLLARVTRRIFGLSNIRRPLLVPTFVTFAALSLSGCATTSPERHQALLIRHAPAPTLVPAGREFAAAEIHAARDHCSFALAGAGASMAPLYPSGTAIVVREQSFITLRPGMAVVYRHRRGHYVAHALVEPRRGGWIARGLNNPEPDDELVTEQNFVGVIKAAFASADTPFRTALAARVALQDEVERGVRTASLP